MFIKPFSNMSATAEPAAGQRARPVGEPASEQPASASASASASVSAAIAAGGVISTLARLVARSAAGHDGGQGGHRANAHADGPCAPAALAAPAREEQAVAQRTAGQPASQAPRGQPDLAASTPSAQRATCAASPGHPAEAGAPVSPGVQGPVVNQDGSINQLNLAQFVGSLMDQFPPLPSGAPTRLQLRREKLLDELKRIPLAPGARRRPASISSCIFTTALAPLPGMRAS